MAGDWIKMRTDLYRDPKVCVMADLLMDENGPLSQFVCQNQQRHMTVTRNVTRNACVGALLSVWGVVRHRGKRVGDDLRCAGVTVSVIDDIADLPGFGEAMEHVGWVIQRDDCIVFPRFFSEYNAEPTEKPKSNGAERQARYRQKRVASHGVTDSVTRDAAGDVTRDVTRDVTVTPREEKRREEYLNPHTPQSAPRDGPRLGGVGILSNLSREDLTDDGRLMRLHQGCVKAGVIDSTEAKRLLFVAEAERCLRIAKDPPAMFATNVRAGLTDRVTEDLEEAARNRLLRMRRKAARPPPIVADAAAALGAKAIQLPGDA